MVNILGFMGQGAKIGCYVEHIELSKIVKKNIFSLHALQKQAAGWI